MQAIYIPPAALKAEIWHHHWLKVDQVPGWLSQEEAFLLHILASHISQHGDVVEIGSYLGRSSVALASGIRTSGPKIHAVDPHTGDITEVKQGQLIDTWEDFRRNLHDSGLAATINPMRETSREAARSYAGRPVELLFIDGWHTTDGVLEDALLWRPHLAPACTIVFDDWAQLPVARAIHAIEDVLPPCRGYVGKDLVFSHRELPCFGRPDNGH